MKVRIRHAGQLSRAVRVRAGEVLRWREQRLGAVDAILRGMPVAAVQVLHGDCTERNFMFRDGQGPIVVDFRAPLRWPVWWEVARFGCAVPAVLAGAVHISRLARLVVAYRQHNAEIPVDNLTAVAQAARCYMTASVTPFQDLVAPGPVMSVADLEGYVETRHAAVVALWDRASDYDEALREALR
jgi:Ser/Thr protein kinase RdoA (MazF antagonist)